MSIASLIALVVIAQLVLLIVILLVIDAPAIRLANRLLAAILLIIAGNLLLFLWTDTGTTPFPPYYRRAMYAICFAIAPLLLFYTRAMVHPAFRLAWRDSFHLLPPLFFVLLTLPGAGVVTDPVAGSAVPTNESLHLLRQTSLLGLLSILLGMAYVFASLRYIRVYERGLLDKFSSLEAVGLRWLRRILYLFITMNVVAGAV